MYDSPPPDTSEDDRADDLAFMREIRDCSDAKLRMLRQWQAVEAWRRIAIHREMNRRGMMP